MLIFVYLSVAEEKRFNQDNDANSNQDHWANDCPGYLGFIDEPDGDRYSDKEGEAEDASPDLAAKYQRRAAG